MQFIFRYLLIPILIFQGCSSSTFEFLPNDLIIENGTIIDGSGKEGYASDLVVRADTIAFIGKIRSDTPNNVTRIDASGKVVTPGFIDAHAHGDPLFGAPLDNFLYMGVTTVVLGQDGFHPTRDFYRKPIELTDWMDSLEARGSQLNVVMFAGHSSIRLGVGVNSDSVPSLGQLGEMGDRLKAYLDAGCFGMSTGLEYAAAMSANQAELEHLAEIVGEQNGLMMSHVRNEDEDQIEASLNELISLGEHCRVHASHLKVVYGAGKERANEVLELIDSARAQGIDISVDVYPYTASYTTIGILFPAWAKTEVTWQMSLLGRRTELERYLFDRVNKRNGPEATLLDRNQYAGMTLKEAAESENISFVELLLRLGPSGGSGAYFIMEDSLMSTLLAAENVMVSSDGSPTMRHPRGYGAFARIIDRYVNSRKTFSLEEAVRKMTSLPAQTIGLDKRGVLSTGNYADILVFDPNKFKEKATYLFPFEYAEGIDYMFINGTLSIEKDIIEAYPGRLLRKN